MGHSDGRDKKANKDVKQSAQQSRAKALPSGGKDSPAQAHVEPANISEDNPLNLEIMMLRTLKKQQNEETRDPFVPPEPAAVNPVYHLDEKMRLKDETDVQNAKMVSWVKSHLFLVHSLMASPKTRNTPAFYIGLTIIVVLLMLAGFRSSQNFNKLVNSESRAYRQVILQTLFVPHLNQLSNYVTFRDAMQLAPSGNLFFYFRARSSGYLYGVHAFVEDVKMTLRSRFLRKRQRFDFTVKDIELFYPHSLEQSHFLKSDAEGRVETDKDIVTFGLTGAKPGHHMFCLILRQNKVPLKAILNELKMKLNQHAFPYNCQHLVVKENDNTQIKPLPYRVNIE